jgi:aminomethyltransferase
MKRTPLYDLNVALGGRMVAFAGYEMPVQFEGVMAEHLAVREGVGLFDVSHMGRIVLRGDGVAEALERLIPQNVVELPEGRQRYGFFTNENGGIIDDMMFAKMSATEVALVANASNKDAILAHLQGGLAGISVEASFDDGLIALQGPKAETVAEQVMGGVADMRFMDVRSVASAFGTLHVTRSGYTGEDGFEISVAADHASALAQALLDAGAVACGLGARDSLRLEAGLCLHGQDIGPDVTPVEAGLVWAMQKRRREGGGFPGAEIIQRQLGDGTRRVRVGLKPEGRAPMRAGVLLFDAEGHAVGEVTSGGFGPTVGGPVAMGYVEVGCSEVGTALSGEVRGKRLPVTVAALPFVPAGFKR